MDKELLKEAMAIEKTIAGMKHAVQTMTAHHMDGGGVERRIAVHFPSFVRSSYTELKLPKQLHSILLDDMRKTIIGEIKVMEAKLEAL